MPDPHTPEMHQTNPCALSWSTIVPVVIADLPVIVLLSIPYQPTTPLEVFSGRHMPALGFELKGSIQ